MVGRRRHFITLQATCNTTTYIDDLLKTIKYITSYIQPQMCGMGPYGPQPRQMCKPNCNLALSKHTYEPKISQTKQIFPHSPKWTMHVSGIHLVPTLKWKMQKRKELNKANKQSKPLMTSLANLIEEEKFKILNTVIQLSIALQTLKKINLKKIAKKYMKYLKKV